MINVAYCTAIFVFINVCIIGCSAVYNPQVTLTGCSYSTLSVNLTGVNDDGIVYILGQGDLCRQATLSDQTDYEFDFVTCNIDWNERIEVVVQKNALYQMTSDRIFPMMCIADTSQLDVGAPVSVGDGIVSDVAINITIKPTAKMSIYKDGVDISGKSAKLGDRLLMNITLAAAFVESFDIKAMQCRASAIQIVNQHCPADVEIFPAFDKPRQGVLLSSFAAFRPTQLAGGSATITFTCVLNVCRGRCNETKCFSEFKDDVRVVNSGGHVIAKRSVMNGNDDLIVGTKVKILYDKIEVTPMPDLPECNPSLMWLIILVALITGCLLSTTCALILYRRFIDALRRLCMINRFTARGEMGAINARDATLSIKSLSSMAEPISKEVKDLDSMDNQDVTRRLSVGGLPDRRVSVALSLADMKRRASMTSLQGVCAVPYN